MEFFRQEYWNGLPFPPPGDLPDPGTEPMSPAYSALAGGFFTASARGDGCLCSRRVQSLFPIVKVLGKISLACLTAQCK